MTKRTKTDTTKKLRGREICPCGSGLIYSACCRKKKIEYRVNRRGQIAITLRISPELQEQLEEGERRFAETFGRKTGHGDLILFDQFLNGEEDHWQVARRTAEVAGVREELIFAWRRSGFMVGEHSHKFMPDTHLDEWEHAITEYQLIKEDGFDPFYVFTYLEADEYEHYKRCVRLIDNIIVIGFNSIRRRKRFSTTKAYFQYLVICSALNSFRTINEMFRSRYDDDCLAILRGIYEQYLKVKRLRIEPGAVASFEAAVNAAAGVFHYKARSDGSLDYARVIDPKTGHETKIVVSNFSIAKSSNFDRVIYQKLYNQLSGHVHHDIATWALKEMVTQKRDLDRKQDSIRAIALILFVGLLLLRESMQQDWILKRDKRDLRFGAKTLIKNLRELLSLDGVRRYSGLPPSLLPAVGELWDELRTTA